MKTKLFALIAIVAGLAVASGTPEKEEKRKDRGKPGIKQWLEKFDANKDGKLDGEERKLLVAYRKAEFMKKFDANKDGKICDKEKKAAAEAMKRRRGGKKPEGQRAKLERKKGKKEGKKK
jgi:hypothetical protein